VNAHAPLPPSGAPQWGYCSGSIMANMQAPDIEHPRTRGGTASHWVFSECLENWRQRAGLDPLLCEDWIGKVAPNGVVIDLEMAEGAQAMVDDCVELASKHNALSKMLIEYRVNMPHINQQNWGTLDFALPLLWYAGDRVTGGEIYLSDYKFGHRENSAVKNLQEINYVAGLVHEFKIDAEAAKHIKVIFRIIQPFCYQAESVSEWVIQLDELSQYFDQLILKAAEAFSNPKFTSGSHCRDCPSIGTCATARRSGYSLIDYIDEPCVIDRMTGQDLAIERGLLTSGLVTAKARLEAIEACLAHRIGKGETDSGLALQNTQGHLAWTVTPAQAVIIANQFGVDASKAGVLTPTQTIAATPKDLRPMIEQALKQVTKRPSKGTKLIKAADSLTARAFKKG